MSVAAINITYKRGTPEAAFKKLGNVAVKALVRSLNRTADGGRTAAVREISKDLRSTQKTIRTAVTTKNATAEKLESQVIARGKRIPLIEMGARQTRRGVTYRLGSKPGNIAGAFIAQMKSGHKGVFKRRGKERLPINELFGPSIPLVFSHRKVRSAIRAVIDERLPRELERNFAFYSRSL